eukprot:jgi/Psemu1/53067/gm1.53067_g
MATQDQQLAKLKDYFQTDDMMKSIKEMDDCKKKKAIASIIADISAKKYIPLKHQYQVLTEIQMKIEHTYKLSKMKDGQKRRKLEGMLDQIWNLKICLKEGAEYYFRQFDALWEGACLMYHYDVPPEICMQKASCTIMIANLPWNVTNQANLDWWNRMGTIDRENVWEAFKIHWTCRLEKINVRNNTNDLADDMVGDKMGDENKDENSPLFNANGDVLDIDNNDKDNDGGRE